MTKETENLFVTKKTYIKTEQQEKRICRYREALVRAAMKEF